MFQRYTEKARRVIFWARYEASQYGSPIIETEHLLLGLLREDRALARRFLGDAYEPSVRTEIETHIPPRERISTSVEMPLSEESKKVLNFAADEADRMGHGHVDTEHLLLALLPVEGSFASQILHARGLKLAETREQLPKIAAPTEARVPHVNWRPVGAPNLLALARLDDFLSGLKWDKSEDLLPYFAVSAHFVDAHGRQWNRAEIEKEFATLFAPYAKKNAAHAVEQNFVESGDVVVVMILWRNAILASMERIWIHRMSVVLVREDEDWKIVLMQVTPVQPA